MFDSVIELGQVPGPIAVARFCTLDPANHSACALVAVRFAFSVRAVKPAEQLPAVDATVDGWASYYRFRPKNAEERAALEQIYAFDRTYRDQYEELMRTGVPGARIVELPGADHFVFYTNEADVLQGMRDFLANLP